MSLATLIVLNTTMLLLSASVTAMQSCMIFKSVKDEK